MTTYIVGYDGSGAAQSAVRFARTLAHATGAEVTAVYVYPAAAAAPYAAVAIGGDPQVSLRQGAQKILDGIAEFDVQKRAIPGGTVVGTLHEFVRSEEGALLVVGATHRGSVGQVVPGSVGERLVHHAPCPVLVVPEHRGSGPIGTVVVAYDGRATSERAVPVAEALAERLGAALRMVTVENFTPLNPEAPAGPGIVAAVESHADLLVMGSRGFGPLRGAFAGGASRYVVDHAPCPVLVIPPKVTSALIAKERRAEV